MRQQSQRITDEEFYYNIVETRVSAIESDKDQLQWEHLEPRGEHLEMHAHSMKYNIILVGYMRVMIGRLKIVKRLKFH